VGVPTLRHLRRAVTMEQPDLFAELPDDSSPGPSGPAPTLPMGGNERSVAATSERILAGCHSSSALTSLWSGPESLTARASEAAAPRRWRTSRRDRRQAVDGFRRRTSDQPQRLLEVVQSRRAAGHRPGAPDSTAAALAPRNIRSAGLTGSLPGCRSHIVDDRLIQRTARDDRLAAQPVRVPSCRVSSGPARRKARRPQC
jgi:hypothetical protein